MKEQLKESEIYSRLFGNKDFTKWKENVIDQRLKVLENSILGIDRQDPYWRDKACDLIIQHQETEFAFNNYFKLMKMNEEHWSTELKKLSK